MREQVKQRVSWRMILVLQAAVCLYSLSGIAAKFASKFAFMSMGFVFSYGIEIVILGIYALIWQQIIMRVEISVAYANRSMVIFWSMLWASLIFSEQITVTNMIGVVLIFIGTWVVNSSD